jgi:hypothetical protein
MLVCIQFATGNRVSDLRDEMDPVRKEWSLEEESKFNEAILDMRLEGSQCVEELIQGFPEKPMYQIQDKNFFVENLCTENGDDVSYGSQLDSLYIEAAESDNFSLQVEKAKELAAIPPSMYEDVGESSRKRKTIEAGDEIGKEFEEATRKESNKGQPWTIEEHEFVFFFAPMI